MAEGAWVFIGISAAVMFVLIAVLYKIDRRLGQPDADEFDGDAKKTGQSSASVPDP